jgi:hypothetical protein
MMIVRAIPLSACIRLPKNSVVDAGKIMPMPPARAGPGNTSSHATLDNSENSHGRHKVHLRRSTHIEIHAKR